MICKASCWTRKNMKEFKKELVSEKESVIKVGHGETVTVRVPTHQEGKYIFWEFATDSYDIGFGLYFEWTEAESNAISVHVSDSSDEEEEFEEEGGRDFDNVLVVSSVTMGERNAAESCTITLCM